MMFPKKKRWQSKKYRDAAKGQPCTMRLSGVCNGNTETTVLAHRNGAGMAMKDDDHAAADMCSSCHKCFDERAYEDLPAGVYLDEEFNRARLETIINRIERGILK
jgi:hypothetical protein